jgi:hypothetical protein
MVWKHIRNGLRPPVSGADVGPSWGYDGAICGAPIRQPVQSSYMAVWRTPDERLPYHQRSSNVRPAIVPRAHRSGKLLPDHCTVHAVLGAASAGPVAWQVATRRPRPGWAKQAASRHPLGAIVFPDSAAGRAVRIWYTGGTLPVCQKGRTSRTADRPAVLI